VLYGYFCHAIYYLLFFLLSLSVIAYSMKIKNIYIIFYWQYCIRYMCLSGVMLRRNLVFYTQKYHLVTRWRVFHTIIKKTKQRKIGYAIICAEKSSRDGKRNIPCQHHRGTVSCTTDQRVRIHSVRTLYQNRSWSATRPSFVSCAHSILWFTGFNFIMMLTFNITFFMYPK